MPEMPHARHHHRNPVLIRRLDHLIIAHRASRLNNRRRTRIGNHIQPIAKRKKCITGSDRTFERETCILRLDGGDFG